jgi:gamma-glutamyl-gamma-aminobutyrate hydrolase PuuD
VVQASYVKFVESGGGIPVPINPMTLDEDEIEELMDKLNGLLFTGGPIKLQEDDGESTLFTKKVTHMYNYAKTIND